MPEHRKLRVFLCHSSNDKPAVRELYQRLKREGWIDPWLDEEKLLPGQDWDLEIEKAVEAADAVIVFLSNNSVTKEGYVQGELRLVLRIADFKPEGTVFIIPLRLENCPMPHRLSIWQYVDYFPKTRKDWAYKRLLGSLEVRAGKLGISTVNPAEEQARRVEEEKNKRDQEERELKEHGEKTQREIEFRRKTEFELRNANQVLQLQLERVEQEAREKKGAEARARVIAERKAETEHVDRERKEPAEKAGNEIEGQEQKSKGLDEEFPSLITKQNLTRFGISSLVLVGLIGLIFGGIYVFRNLPVFTEPTPTEKVVIPTNTRLIASTPNPPQVVPTPSVIYIPEEPTVSPTLGVGSTMVSEKDGMVMVYVPAGKFEMGSENGQDDEKPVHTVYLDAFWVDQTEVTNAMYSKCVQVDKCNQPWDTTYYSDSNYSNHPVIVPKLVKSG